MVRGFGCLKKHIASIALLLSVVMLVPFAQCYCTDIESTNNTTDEYQFDNAEGLGTNKGRKTPLMGWSSWNAFGPRVDEEKVMAQIECIKKLGLDKLGYTYVNIDDDWQCGRDENNYVKTDLTKFPDGMKYIADYAHSQGLKAGIYTDAGLMTCSRAKDSTGANGLYGHQQEDLTRYLDEWGYDFIKVDWCGAGMLNQRFEPRYTSIGDDIKKIEDRTGKDKIFNICCWNFPGMFAPYYADSWRINGDISPNFESILAQTERAKPLAEYCGPGHVNDLDSLQVGNGMTLEEDKTHFSMWCMMSAPLILGNDLRNIGKETLNIISNQELIALDQDPACLQATAKVDNDTYEIWAKPLGSKESGTQAIAIMNKSNEEQNISLDFNTVGLSNVSVVRNLWTHKDIAVSGSFSAKLQPHGITVLKVYGDYVDQDGLFMQSATEEVDQIGPFGDNDTCFRNFEDSDIKKYIGVKDESHNDSGVLKASTMVSNNQEVTVYIKQGTDGSADVSYAGEKISIPAIGKNGKYLKVTLFCNSSASEKLDVEAHGDAYISAVEVSSEVTKTVYKSKPLTVMTDNTLIVRQSVALTNPKINNVTYVAAFYDKDGKFISAKSKSYEDKNGKCDIESMLQTKGNKSGTLKCYLLEDGLPISEQTSMELSCEETVNYDIIDGVKARDLVSNGAVLLDVRSDEEYNEGHIDGAAHLEYTKVLTDAQKMFKDKNVTIVTYCASSKRSVQAMRTLKEMGYTNVFCVGSMDNYNNLPKAEFVDAENKPIKPGSPIKIQMSESEADYQIMCSAGENSTFDDAVDVSEFKFPDSENQYETVKAYAVYNGKEFYETKRQFMVLKDNLFFAYASDYEVKQLGLTMGIVRRDKSLDQHTITVDGTTYNRGLGTQAYTQVEFDIPKGSKRFIAVAGIDDEVAEKNQGAMCTFSVYIDGNIIGEKQSVKLGEEYLFDIPIEETSKKIKLVSDKPKDSKFVNADWAIAGFSK